MATTDQFSTLMDEIGKRAATVRSYLLEQQTLAFDYKHLEDSVYSYVKAGGKSLRPAVLMFACGAVGGAEDKAVPAAAAVELYHTFTLVHDDIIDRDELRRNVPTVHVDFARRAKSELHFDDATAEHYGLALAILAGDIQQGWAASSLPALFHDHGLSPELVLNLVFELFRRVQVGLISGEALDIVLSWTPVEQVTEEQILKMLWQKTGILYEFCGRAGAAIGLNEADLQHGTVDAIANFAGKCGTAFQIQDDILGIVGDEGQLGKAVGADIREGKRTLVLTGCLPNLSAEERDFMLGVLGNRAASVEDIARVAALMRDRGGIDHAKAIALQYVQDALTHLDPIADSPSKEMLKLWADYIIEREL